MRTHKDDQTRNMTMQALFAAIVCISTMVIHIPIPLGYMHLGNTCILLAGVLGGPVTGALAGGIGSALADLLSGYTEWILPTLLIKSVMGYVIGRFARGKNLPLRMMSVRTLIGAAAGILVMVLGYFVAGTILYGSIVTGATQIPGLVIEGLIGIGLFYVMGFALEKAKVLNLLHMN